MKTVNDWYKITTQRKKQLKLLHTKLCKYCHASTCENIYDCPKMHEECSERLDLNTGIAWTTAMLIEDYMTGKEFQDIVKRFSSLYYLVNLHFEKYEELFSLIRDVDITFDRIMEEGLMKEGVK